MKTTAQWITSVNCDAREALTPVVFGHVLHSAGGSKNDGTLCELFLPNGLNVIIAFFASKIYSFATLFPDRNHAQRVPFAFLFAYYANIIHGVHGIVLIVTPGESESFFIIQFTWRSPVEYFIISINIIFWEYKIGNMHLVLLVFYVSVAKKALTHKLFFT